MKKGKILLMAVVFLLGGMQVLLKTASPEAAKDKKIKLNRTKITVKKGRSFQLKWKNTGTKKLRSVKWNSSNEFTASVNKNGKVTGRRLGGVTVTAKVGKKKYRCKVQVVSDIDADKIKMEYANDVFTESRLGKTTEIRYSQISVKDRKAIKAVYSIFSSMKMKEVSPDPKLDEIMGGAFYEFVMNDGKTFWFRFAGGRIRTSDGKEYEYEYKNGSQNENYEKLAKLIQENQDWGYY